MASGGLAFHVAPQLDIGGLQDACRGYGSCPAPGGVLVVVYISTRQAQGSSSPLCFSQLQASKQTTYRSVPQRNEKHGRLCLPLLIHSPATASALLPLACLRLRPLRAPLQSRLLHLLAHTRRRFVRVRRGGRVPQRRPARRGGPGAVPRGRRLRRLLPGTVQGQEALQRRRRQGRRHRPRQDQVEPHGPRAQQPGVRRHGPPRRGQAARQAPRRRRRVQEGAVRARGEEPRGEGGGHQPRAQPPRRQVPLPGRPDRHRRRRRRAGRVVELEVHDAGPRPGVEHEHGAAGAAAVQDRRHRRVRREVGVGRQGGAASAVARRRGLRHRGADHGHRARGLLSLRHAGVEVKVRAE